jgi:hypothetical protein
MQGMNHEPQAQVHADAGVRPTDGKRWMVVMCDTYDHGDYPLFCDTPEEIYGLHEDRAAQLAIPRVYNLPPKRQINGNP